MISWTTGQSKWIGGVAVLAGMLGVVVGIVSASIATGVVVTILASCSLVAAVSLATSRSGTH